MILKRGFINLCGIFSGMPLVEERQGAHCQGMDGLKRGERGLSGPTEIRPLAMEYVPSLFLKLSQYFSLINTQVSSVKLY